MARHETEDAPGDEGEEEQPTVEINLFAKGASNSDLADALRHAAKQIDDGYLAGDLRNENVDIGSWDISDSEDE